MNKLTELKVLPINDNEVLIRWKITYWCNFRCEYCIQGNHDDVNLMPLDTLLDHAAKINAFIKENLSDKKIRFVLIGGEIFVYDVYKLFEVLTKDIKNFSIQITSNFSFPIEKYKKTIDFVLKNNIKYNMVFSYHYQYWKGFDFLDKLKTLQSYYNDDQIKKLSFNIQYTVTENNFNIVKEQIETADTYNFKQINYNVDIERAKSMQNAIIHSQEVIDFCNQKRSKFNRKNIICTFDDGSEIILTRSDLMTNYIEYTHTINGLCKSDNKMFEFNSDNNQLSFRKRLCEKWLSFSKIDADINEIVCQKKYCPICTPGVLIRFPNNF